MTERRLSVWPPLPPNVYERPVPAELPYPLGSHGAGLFARARHALFHGVRNLGLIPGDQVLVPAYHHGSEVEALIRADLEPRFYEAGERLEPDPEELASLVGSRVRALHLTHYLGFPQDVARWRRWADDHGLLLIEDAAQAWLADSDGAPAGSAGDIALVCYYKTVGVPEGAALVTRELVPPPSLDDRRGLWQVVRRHGAWVAARSAVANGLSRSLQGRGNPAPEREWALGDPDAGVWRTVPWLLPRLCDPGIAARRRANYRMLLEALGPECVPTPFERVPSGASPFAFPVETDDKAELLRRLASRGIEGLDFWSVPHPTLPANEFPGARSRRERTVGLPVHQELRPKDLEHIADAVQPRRARGAPALRIERDARIPDVDADWSLLSENAGNLFSTPEWLATWWRHYGSGQPIILRLYRPGGELTAIVPLCRGRIGPLRTLRFAGYGPSDELGPICRPADAPVVARALRDGLRRGAAGEWDLLVAERLSIDRTWSGLLGGSVLQRESSPVLERRGRTFEEVLAERSGNFRSQVRRRARKLEQERGISYRLADDPARLEEDLERLFGLHSARWGSASTAFSPRRRAFHREFAARALERDWLRFWLAEVEDRPVAALLGYRFAGSEFYYQSGRDPAWDRYAVGFVLLAHSVRTAIDEGVSEYRFLRGDEPYKLRFADRDPGLETFVTSRGAALGEAVSLAAPIVERPAARRWVARLAGTDPT